MNEELQAIRDKQKESWNKFSGGWKKWNTFTMDFLKPMGDMIINSLHITANDVVLDIASGTGEPAFSIAALATDGKVYATDLADQMLNIAKEYADANNINNIEFKVADVSDLPFENNFFDKVSCRMGFMFFPDMQLAANEIFRVCKSGGKLATAVWGAAENNEWVTIIMKVLSNNVQMPQPQPGAPGMFRCAKPGLMKDVFEKAGFKNVKEETFTGKIIYDSIYDYWQNMNEIAAPVVGALSKADAALQQKIKDEVFEACKKKLINEQLVFDHESIIFSAEK
jgi:ubiquinone/menaquinone biosynthesis C-methylase UbiE